MVDIKSLEARYVAIYGKEPCEAGAVVDIERALGVELPADFKEISAFYSGGLLGGVSQHEFAVNSDATNMVQETLRLRETVGIGVGFLVLAEPSESIIFLNVSGGPAVIWCDAVDVYNLNSREFSSPPDTWETYGDFFSYLLGEEEVDSTTAD